MNNFGNEEFHFDKVFKEKNERMEYVYRTYNKIYDLKNIYYKGKVSRELFNYVLKRNFFVLLVIYDENHRIYLERNIQDDLFWSLPGGSIKKNEEIRSAIIRIVGKISSSREKVVVGEIEPIAFVTNNFKYKDKDYSHYGLAFTMRLRNENKINIDDSIGSLVYPFKEEINKINRFANKEVVKLAIKRLETFDTPFSEEEEEVSVNEKYNFRYMIHNQFVKRFLLTDKLKRKQEFINILRSFVGSAESLIDVSCGDSNLIEKIAHRNSRCIIANDISWSQIALVKGSSSVIYTNHNAENLPFKENLFDVVYCGNTLHHMKSKKSLLNLFKNIAKVGKKIIIVEIENPKESGMIPFLLNKYWYGCFLKDVGGSYFNKYDFQSIVSDFFINNFDIEFSEFKNIQGNYLISVLTKKDTFLVNSKVFEIEHKFRCKDTDLLIKQCKENGYKYLSHQKEKDIYYTDIDGVFVKDRICLRIRTTDSKSELTYKDKSTNLRGSYSKEENNIYIKPTQITSTSELLSSLGYLKYSTVNKDRVTFSKKMIDYEINIMIDKIKNAGNFVELELITDSQKNKKEINAYENLLKEEVNKYKNTGLEEATLPYRDYVAQYIKRDLCQAKKIKAVLFDFDGTIAPTEKMFFNIFKSVIKNKFNKNITHTEYKENELNKNEALFDMLKKETSIKNINKKEFMKVVYRQYNAQIGQLAENKHLITNLRIIRMLKAKGYKVAIVSTSKRKFIIKILRFQKCADLFDLIIAREDVNCLKPDPEAYLLALKKLHLKAQDCLAIEDSERGVRSAKSALINCLVVHDNSFSSEEVGTELNTEDINDISEVCLPLLYS